MQIGIGLGITMRRGVDNYAVAGASPKLVSDFERELYRTGGNPDTFASMFTFARASTATYVDSTGTLQTAASGEPRIGHHVWDGSKWVNEGLLIESESRTNLITHSEDFTDANWVGTSAGSFAVDATGVDGEISATTFVDDGSTGSGQVRVVQDVTVSTTTTYSFSIFVKEDQLSWVRLAAINFTTPANTFAYFDLTNGAVGTVDTALDNAFIEDFGNGWHRCTIVFTTDGSDITGQLRVNLSDGDGNITVNLDGTSSILIYGAQLEEGSTPSSYIPTSGSQVTRASETLTIAAADLPYSSTAMSIAMEGTMTYADGGDSAVLEFLRWFDTSDDWVRFTLDTQAARTGMVEFYQKYNTVLDGVESTDSAYSPGVNVPFNIASRHGSTFINGAVDGTPLTANTTPTALPDLSATDLDLAFNFMGTIRQFRMWDADLGNTGIAGASS